MKGPAVELTTEEIERLIQRLDTETLRDDDLPKIKAIIKAYLSVTHVLQEKKVSIKKLSQMIFGARTEKAKKIIGRIGSAAKALCGNNAKAMKDSVEKPRGHGRKGAWAYTGAEKIIVPHPTMKPADGCPECKRGKVYPSVDPGVFVKITGGAPLKSQVWETEKLRCNLCGELYPAPLPEEAGTEKYDETAGAMVVLLRYGSGFPCNRLEQLQESMGSPLPASTQWEIAYKTSHRGPAAVYKEMTRQAAHGHTIYNDDTAMKILSMMNNTNDQDRKGIFTTGMVSVVEDRVIQNRTETLR
jgi:transposase